MRRLMALAAAGAVAAGVAGIVALTGQAASAAPSNTGLGSEVACVVQQGTSFSSCLDITVNGSISAGRSNASGSIQVDKARPGASAIAKIQIDRVAVGTQHTSIANSGSVNSGTPPKPISARTGGPDPYYTRCDVRYHTLLEYAVRLTNGQLKTGSFFGPWFDSNYATCAGANYGPAVSAVQCMLHSPGEACVRVEASAALSNDGKSLYARGTITVPEGVNSLPGGSSKIARVQVDHAVLGRQSSAVRVSASMNSGSRRPLSAMGQTMPGYAWSTNCNVHHQVALEYTVRLTDGRLFHGRIATPIFKAPSC